MLAFVLDVVLMLLFCSCYMIIVVARLSLFRCFLHLPVVRCILVCFRVIAFVHLGFLVHLLVFLFFCLFVFCYLICFLVVLLVFRHLVLTAVVVVAAVVVVIDEDVFAVVVFSGVANMTQSMENANQTRSSVKQHVIHTQRFEHDDRYLQSDPRLRPDRYVSIDVFTAGVGVGMGCRKSDGVLARRHKKPEDSFLYHEHDRESFNPSRDRWGAALIKAAPAVSTSDGHGRWIVTNIFPVHSAMFSVHFFLCLPLFSTLNCTLENGTVQGGSSNVCSMLN